MRYLCPGEFALLPGPHTLQLFPPRSPPPPLLPSQPVPGNEGTARVRRGGQSICCHPADSEKLHFNSEWPLQMQLSNPHSESSFSKLDSGQIWLQRRMWAESGPDGDQCAASQSGLV
ncbi:hypothetical protein J4Q44_G00071300 [Coregonus suidteri]|uniref:Uncharacterized protein n=1 Tax=Coregonus suidteri TaxID=861788 RepID=A0AAN8R3R7_9TELE